MSGSDQAAQLARLKTEVLACRACEQAGYLARANPIGPVGTGREQVLVIGQAPGPVTDQKGYHFAGPAGRTLDQWFQRAGFAPGAYREMALLSSLTRCFPGKSRVGNGDRPPSRQELALCREFLDRELQLLQPALVVLVGKMAIDAFLGQQLLTAVVGRLHERDGRRYLPLPHASGVSRWLNEPAHRLLLDQALEALAELRVQLALDSGDGASQTSNQARVSQQEAGSKQHTKGQVQATRTL